MAKYSDMKKSEVSAAAIHGLKVAVWGMRRSIDSQNDMIATLSEKSDLHKQDIDYMKAWLDDLLATINSKAATFQLPITDDDSGEPM